MSDTKTDIQFRGSLTGFIWNTAPISLNWQGFGKCGLDVFYN